MKRLLVIMLILVAVGVVSAATITVHADTYIKLSYRIADSGDDFTPASENVIHVDGINPTFLFLQIKWWGGNPLPQFANYEYVVVNIFNPSDDIHLYYQFVTGNNDPTNPNQ